LTELLGRWADYFGSLPVWSRTTILIVAGPVLTLAATRRFQDETALVLADIPVAVFLSWMAFVRFM
jgi:hypothetical protein